MKTRSIAWQLILNSVIPVLLAFVVLAVVNYRHSYTLQEQSFTEKRAIISHEIKHIFSMQDIALELLEYDLQERMRSWSQHLVGYYLRNGADPLKLDLNAVHREMGMDSLVDIYIINKDGRIISTTYEKDLGLNLYEFGEDHKIYLQEVFESGEFVSERFATEASTFKLKKYTYQATPDGAYIVELGSYSPKLDYILETVNGALSELSDLQEGITNVELFIVTDEPFSMNTNRRANEEEARIIKDVFKTGSSYTDKQEAFNGRTIYQDYSLADWKSTNLYKGAVVRITSDRENIRALLVQELRRTTALFGLATLLVAVLIYRQTNRLTNPLKILAEKVQVISQGDFKQRVAIEGNNEITQLSEQFNQMVEKLEEFYRTLEDKVRERTTALEDRNEEIRMQRDRLSSQNKRIRSSIEYAKSIQNAILPAQEFIDQTFRNFIIYRPKDIVSGDSYWLHRLPVNAEGVEKTVFFAAIDCTGHGVPGAFMSVIADRLLNTIVTQQGVRQPRQILAKLDQGVRATLRQDETTNDDGMDMVLIRFDYLKRGDVQLTFSGAKRPLHYYSKVNSSLWSKKGSIRSIGGNRYGLKDEFEDTVLRVNKGDMIYIGSDGITDQPNAKRKKFGSARLFSLLTTNAEKPIKEQLRIVEEQLDEHIKGVEQYDDITLIGIEV